MCFIHEWNTGFSQRFVAPTLSQLITGGIDKETLTSVINEQIQLSFAILVATDLYLASIDKRESLIVSSSSKR